MSTSVSRTRKEMVARLRSRLRGIIINLHSFIFFASQMLSRCWFLILLFPSSSLLSHSGARRVRTKHKLKHHKKEKKLRIKNEFLLGELRVIGEDFIRDCRGVKGTFSGIDWMEIHQTRDHNSHCYPLPLSAPPRRILGSELQKISSPLDFPAISIKLSGKLHRNRHILALLLRQLGESRVCREEGRV